jgi:hypothetical protein
MKTALCASLLVLAMLMQPAASAKDLKTPRPVERSLIATTSAYTIEEEIHCADQRKRTVDYCEVRCAYVAMAQVGSKQPH